MPVFTGSPVITDNGDGTFHVQMGPWGFDYEKQKVIDIANGNYKDKDLLIGAFVDFILRNNTTLTFAAIRAALQAATFKW